MPHTHLRPTAAFLIAALACCVIVNSGRTQTNAPLRLTATPAHATSLNPSLSGDGRRVAFESSADLTGAGGAHGFRAFLADVSGEAATFVRLAASRAPSAALSQDGSRVAFASAEDLTGANPDRNTEIFLRDGAALSQLTATAPEDAAARTRDGSFQPSLSDDGRLVAFSSNRDLTGANPDGNFEIFVHDTAARTFTQITNSVAVVGASAAKVCGDGSHVAYVRDDSAPGAAEDARRDLILYDLRADAARVVAGDVPGLALTPGRAASDDGLRVVYAAESAGGASQVFVYDGRNDAVRQLTTLGTRASDVPLHPTISGDGSRVAFATRRSVFAGEPGGGVDLYVFDLPTSKLTRVTDAPSRATAEVVSSLDDGGAVVAFNFPRVLADPAVEDEFANTSEIFVARLDARPPFATDLEILHAASLSRAPDKSLAPGQIAVARGRNLSLVSARSLPAPDKSFPRAFRGVGVSVNGRPAPIFFVSPAQINFQIPAETETGAALVVVRNHDGYESRAEVQIAQAAPGVFTESGDGRGTAVALDALNLLRGPFDPSDAAGEPRRLSIFTTGLGRARSVSVTAAGLDLAVEAVIPSPDLPGLEEVHVLLQRRLAGAGVVPLVINADGRAGNATTLHFVGARRPARLALTPDEAALGVGRSLRFSAAVFDADGFLIDGAPVSFSSSDVSVATVDGAGTARGVGTGVATIRASAGEVSATAELRVRPLSLVLNEALADPPDGAAGDANRDGSRSPSQDEFVEIVNASDVDIDLGGHSLATRAPGGAQATRHVFAAGTILAPGTSAVVFGGAVQSAFNPDDATFGGAHVSTASTGGLSLLNSGATITLLDPSGAPVEELTYGETGGPDGDRNQSLTRAPDVTGDFSLHLSAATDQARAFSPGTRADGTPFAPSAPVARIEIDPASATIQVGASQRFNARAFGADGRELEGVIFLWQTGDASVAAVDERGLALGVKAGAAEIFARGRGVESPRATLTVTPPPRRVVRVEVTPQAAAVNRGGTQKFSARAFDQNDREVADAVFAWRSSAPAVASVGADGLARGAGVGPVKIVASTPDGAGGTAEAEATLEVRVPLALNELLADVPADDAATAAVEGDANRDGLRRSDDDEFVELINVSDSSVDLSGLRLSDSTAARFTFPAHTSLAPGRAAVVFGGGSPPANDPAFGGALVLTAASLGLNDGGDTVSLKLTVGGAEVAVITQNYGPQGGPPAPSDQSLTRAPDTSANRQGGELVPHATAANSAGRAFSPGTRADGTPFGSPPVARIDITPAAASLDLGAAQTFAARAFANAGGTEVEIPNVSFAWESSDHVKAPLAPVAGAFTAATARAAGRLTIRARAGGLQAEAALRVNPPPSVLTRIDVTPGSASVVVGGTQQFDAKAFDQFDSEMAGVSFVWATSDPAVAAIDARGLASGLRPGATQIRASAGEVTSPPAALGVTPPPRRVARIELTPAAATVNRGGAQRFSAIAFDGDGQPVADATIDWSSSDAAVAAVDASGLAHGAGAGLVSITASTPDGAGGTAAANAALEVRLPLALNELLADVPADDTATAAVEGDSNRDGVRNSGDDELVELLNASDAPVNLSGLRLSDAAGTRFTFPAGTQLEAGRSVVVFGGGRAPADDPAFGGALLFAASALSLNDGGDTLALKLTVGSAEFVVFTQTYGTSGGPPAPSDQSLTRAPDASAASAAGEFTPHLGAPGSQGRSSSPGTRADGTPFGSPPVARIEIAPAAASLDIGGTRTFTARAFTGPAGAEVEITNVSFNWDVSDAAGASLSPATGRATNATALAAGQITVRARAGGQQATATLTVNPPPPFLARVELTPQSASLDIGRSRQFTARAFDQHGAPLRVNSITFTSSAPNAASVDSQSFTPGGSEATATVTARGGGTSHITAIAGDGARTVASAPAVVTVEPPPVVPAAGQLIINEALVSFSTSATQPRADFVELYNPTDRTLDISGLSVSFRAGGSSNNIRAVTLPGAVGSGTLRIRPRSYFLIINGAQTFGAIIQTEDGQPDGYDAGREATEINPATGAAVPSTCAAASSCFDLNNTTGAIKIEIGGAKLDGLAYKGGADPAAHFLAFGEGTLFAFTSGTTNDLVRTPNAADTNDNAADFRRNGSTGSVTPKAANP